jgi:hypothetical protein
MGTLEAVHTAARRFCMEQSHYWVEEYNSLPREDEDSPEDDSIVAREESPEGYRIFPRYRLAQETLVNIERLIFELSASMPQLKEELLKAGSSALESLADQLWDEPTALLALQDQLSAYSAFIKQLDANTSHSVEPLPFRRVLSSEEVAALWLELLGSWGVRGKADSWFPLSDDPKPAGALAFHTDLWNARQGDALFQQFLARENVVRCFLLRELGPPGYELDRELAKPFYDGSEKFIFKDSSWMIYASHEFSLTLVGSVAEFFREEWSDADSLGYRGPFYTTDLRGTWGERY